jgi:cyclopropane-fatty-acyl-phospholipid synthase
MNSIQLAESGLVPDALIRAGIRRMLAQRLREVGSADCETSGERLSEFVEELRRSPVAELPELANEQHYEVPPAFFEEALGRRLKYSCGLWPEGVGGLDAAESAMLTLTCERAGIRDGMTVLDLGCGWGSLSIWIAEHFPACQVVAVSNSKLQREHILARCAHRGLDNVEVQTADMNRFEADRRFDRVVSIEMFEHMRNYELLMGRVARWLKPGGKLFVHVFCHREYAYPFGSEKQGDWMGRHFFSGGIMPSDDLLLHFQRDLTLERKWRVNGTHYQKTCEAWLQNTDARREKVLSIFAAEPSEESPELRVQRWRIFFLACSELFGFRGGNEWFVSHYLFGLPAARVREGQ